MPSANSYLESGVWCPDEGSGDNLSSTAFVTNTARAKLKHSGGSVDASGDVEIVDIKDSEWQQYHKFCLAKSNKGSNHLRRGYEKKRKSKQGSTSSVGAHWISEKRRSSSFSKVFSCNRKYRSEVLNRRSSFGNKRIPKRHTSEIDDSGIHWQDEKQRRAPSDTYFSISSDRHGEKTSRYYSKRMARSERGSLANNTFSRSIVSRPSIASSTIREFDDPTEDDDAVSEESGLHIAEKRLSNMNNVLSVSVDEVKKNEPSIERMVENINMRNFMDIADARPSSDKEKFSNHTRWFKFLIVLMVVSLLLLGLTAWHIREAIIVRKELQELRSQMHEFMASFETASRNQTRMNQQSGTSV